MIECKYASMYLFACMRQLMSVSTMCAITTKQNLFQNCNALKHKGNKKPRLFILFDFIYFFSPSFSGILQHYGGWLCWKDGVGRRWA